MNNAVYTSLTTIMHKSQFRAQIAEKVVDNALGFLMRDIGMAEDFETKVLALSTCNSLI